MTISERLFTILKEKNITQKKLAEELEIKTATVSAWNKRGTNPPIEYVLKICDFLNVSIEYLINGDSSTQTTKELDKQTKELITAYNNASFETKNIVRKILDLETLDKNTNVKLSISKTG